MSSKITYQEFENAAATCLTNYPNIGEQSIEDILKSIRDELVSISRLLHEESKIKNSVKVITDPRPSARRTNWYGKSLEQKDRD